MTNRKSVEKKSRTPQNGVRPPNPHDLIGNKVVDLTHDLLNDSLTIRTKGGFSLTVHVGHAPGSHMKRLRVAVSGPPQKRKK